MIEFNIYASWAKAFLITVVSVGALASLVWVLTRPMWTLRDNRAKVLPPADETFRAPRLRTVSSPPVAYPTTSSEVGLTNDPIATATLLGMGFSPAPQIAVTTDISANNSHGDHQHAVTPAEVHAPVPLHQHAVHTQSSSSYDSSPVVSHDSHASHTYDSGSSSSSYDSGSCSYDSGSSSSSFD